MYIKWEDYILQRDIVIDMLYVSVVEGRLHQEELVEVAKRLYGLTGKVVGELDIFAGQGRSVSRSRSQI